MSHKLYKHSLCASFTSKYSKYVLQYSKTIFPKIRDFKTKEDIHKPLDLSTSS